MPTTHQTERGHSNVLAHETESRIGDRAKASIPLRGGKTIKTYGPLPPLVMTQAEWETIGRAMGWLP